MPEPSPELLVWRALLGELVAGRPAVLAVVVAHTGSSAGRCGFVMAVGRDGWLAGTIGGGTPQSLRAHQAAEATKWRNMIKSAGIKAE